MHYHLLEYQGGVETQTIKAMVMTTLRGLADISLSENHYCIRSISRLKTCNNVCEIDFFQIKDLRHPDDTSIRVTADVVNFVMNPVYVYCT